MNDVLASIVALRLGGAAVSPLRVLAVLGMAIMLEKLYLFWARIRVPALVVDMVESDGFRWEELESQLQAIDPRHDLARFFRVIFSNREHPIGWTRSRVEDEATRIGRALHSLIHGSNGKMAATQPAAPSGAAVQAMLRAGKAMARRFLVAVGRE